MRLADSALPKPRHDYVLVARIEALTAPFEDLRAKSPAPSSESTRPISTRPAQTAGLPPHRPPIASKTIEHAAAGSQEPHPRHGPFAPGHRRLEPFLRRAEGAAGPPDPEPARADRLQPAGETGNPAETAAAGAPAAANPVSPAQPLNRADALLQSPRIVIDTKSLFGTIALKGARLDDLELKDYRETTDPKSANIVLLSPSGAPDGYFIDINYLAPRGVSLDLPKSDSLWTADGQSSPRRRRSR